MLFGRGWGSLNRCSKEIIPVERPSLRVKARAIAGDEKDEKYSAYKKVKKAGTGSITRSECFLFCCLRVFHGLRNVRRFASFPRFPKCLQSFTNLQKMYVLFSSRGPNLCKSPQIVRRIVLEFGGFNPDVA